MERAAAGAGAAAAPGADTRHTLTATEREWCVALRAALRAEERGIGPGAFTDFEVAQFAIVAKGDIRKALKRMRRYQHVIRGKYGYGSAGAASNPALGALNRFVPACAPHMALAGEAPDGSQVQVADMAALDAGKLAEDEAAQLLTDMVICSDAQCCDLDAVRGGSTLVVVARGVGWRNYSSSLSKKASELLFEAYPKRIAAAVVVDGGWIVGPLLALVRVFVKAKIMRKVAHCAADELYAAAHGGLGLGLGREAMPAMAGGTRAESYEQDLRAGLARRAESMRRVRI